MGVDRRYLERPGNIVIEGEQDAEARRRLTAMAQAAQSCHDSKCWVQLGHAGRQCDPMTNMQPVGPSAEAMQGLASFARGRPRAMTLEEVQDVPKRMAHAAKVVKDCGFSGVQLHAAHGYLLSSFLNPRANKREDAYGGSLENRARLLLDSVTAVRAAVGTSFAVSVKINSSDFQKGGFTTEECAKVAGWLEDVGLDLLELSGGNYEEPAMMVGGGVFGKVNRSTVLREAFFMEFARDIRKSLKHTPIMVTGGIRSKATMQLALDTGDCDVIGIGRPLCGAPDASNRLLTGELSEMPRYEKSLHLPMPLLPLMFTSFGPKFRFLCQMQWCFTQERNIGFGSGVDSTMGILRGMLKNQNEDRRQAAALKGMNCSGQITNAQESSSRPTLMTATIATLLIVLLVHALRRRR